MSSHPLDGVTPLWKHVMVAIAVLVLLAVLMFLGTPLFTIKHLRHSIETRDPARVAPLVDFPALRRNLGTTTDRKIEKSNDGAFLEPLKNWVVEHIADGVLDRITTPAGLIRLVCDGKDDGDLAETRNQPCVLKGKETGMHYLSYDRFRIDMRQANGKPMSLVFDREGVYSWRLVNATGVGGGS